MRELIAKWCKRLEADVAAERGEAKFKEAVGLNEYVHVFAPDSSMLEVVLERGWGIYRKNRYTRIVWSANHPAEVPFLYKSYEYNPNLEKEPWANPEKPKQAFYDDKEFKADFMTAVAIEEVFFNKEVALEDDSVAA